MNQEQTADSCGIQLVLFFTYSNDGRLYRHKIIEYLSTSAKLWKFSGQMSYELHYLSEIYSDFNMKMLK
jgi:hypothetical protein